MRTLVLVVATVFGAAGVALAASPAPSTAVALVAQHGSKIGGTATIRHSENENVVSIVLHGVFVPENRYPAAIYNGTCGNLSAAPDYELTPVMGGLSITHLRLNRSKRGRRLYPSYAVAVFNLAGTKTMSCGEFAPAWYLDARM
jgi:hypothetical protein